MRITNRSSQRALPLTTLPTPGISTTISNTKLAAISVKPSCCSLASGILSAVAAIATPNTA